MFVQNLKILGQEVPAKSLTKISIFITCERVKEKGEIEKEGKYKSQHLGTTLDCSHPVHKL